MKRYVIIVLVLSMMMMSVYTVNATDVTEGNPFIVSDGNALKEFFEDTNPYYVYMYRTFTGSDDVQYILQTFNDSSLCEYETLASDSRYYFSESNHPMQVYNRYLIEVDGEDLTSEIIINYNLDGASNNNLGDNYVNVVDANYDVYNITTEEYVYTVPVVNVDINVIDDGLKVDYQGFNCDEVKMQLYKITYDDDGNFVNKLIVDPLVEGLDGDYGSYTFTEDAFPALSNNSYYQVLVKGYETGNSIPIIVQPTIVKQYNVDTSAMAYQFEIKRIANYFNIKSIDFEGLAKFKLYNVQTPESYVWAYASTNMIFGIDTLNVLYTSEFNYTNSVEMDMYSQNGTYRLEIWDMTNYGGNWSYEPGDIRIASYVYTINNSIIDDDNPTNLSDDYIFDGNEGTIGDLTNLEGYQTVDDIIANVSGFVDEGTKALNLFGNIFSILPSPIPEAITFVVGLSIALFIIKLVRG